MSDSLGIKNKRGLWYQQDGSIDIGIVDVFGGLLGAHVFRTERAAKSRKTRLQRAGFIDLTVCECDPLSAISDKDITGLIEED